MIRVQPIDRHEWRNEAACRDTDPELFFPSATSGPAYERQVAEAKAVCNGCVVAPLCLDEAMDVRDGPTGSVDESLFLGSGVAGGLDEHERHQAWREGQRMRAALEQARGAVHNTDKCAAAPADAAQQGGGRREELTRWHADDVAAERAGELADEGAWSR